MKGFIDDNEMNGSVLLLEFEPSFFLSIAVVYMDCIVDKSN